MWSLKGRNEVEGIFLSWFLLASVVVLQHPVTCWSGACKSWAGACTFYSCRWSRYSIEPLFAGPAVPVTGTVGLSWILHCWRWPLDPPLFLLRQGYNLNMGQTTLLLIPRGCPRISSFALAKKNVKELNFLHYIPFSLKYQRSHCFLALNLNQG